MVPGKSNRRRFLGELHFHCFSRLPALLYLHTRYKRCIFIWMVICYVIAYNITWKCFKLFFFCTLPASRYPACSRVGRGSLVDFALLPTPLSTFRQILQALRVDWRNSTRRFVSTQGRCVCGSDAYSKKWNIWYFNFFTLVSR